MSPHIGQRKTGKQWGWLRHKL